MITARIDLHSNMFLLRLQQEVFHTYEISKFTFQYVSIKTFGHFSISLIFSRFTFQYVSIKTRCQKARQSSDQSGAFCLPNNILLLKLSLSIFNNTTVCKLNLFEVVDPLEFQRHWVSTEKLYNKTCAFVFLSPKLFIQPFLLSAAENNYGIQFSIYMRL